MAKAAKTAKKAAHSSGAGQAATNAGAKKSSRASRSTLKEEQSASENVSREKMLTDPLIPKMLAPNKRPVRVVRDIRRKKSANEATPAPNGGIVARPEMIPQTQWELPAGFLKNGAFASLAQVVSDPVPTVSLESLSGEEKKKLVLERIKLQADFPTRYMIGIGAVNKDRAIAEVEASSQAGKVIQESEQKLIQMLQNAATTR